MADHILNNGSGPPGQPWRFVIDGRFTIGSIINLIVLVAGMIAFFTRIETNVASLQANFGEFKSDVKATLVRLESKLDQKADRPLPYPAVR